jgi:hypothetical protein
MIEQYLQHGQRERPHLVSPTKFPIRVLVRGRSMEIKLIMYNEPGYRPDLPAFSTI